MNKTIIANDGKACIIRCPSCGAVSRVNYLDKETYLRDLRSPCRRCK